METDTVETHGFMTPGMLPRMSPVSRVSDLPRDRYRQALLRLGWLLLFAGLLVRVERYLLQFPIWNDEAFVALNCVERDYAGLTEHLQFGQVVPILFLWGEHTVWRLLGPSECAMRLLPLLLGGAGLCLVWWLARRTSGSLVALLTVGILSVSMWPISMSSSVKPYSADLFCAVLLFAVAVNWLRRPERDGRMLLLAVLAPLAIMTSYPAVFVAGGISLALLPTVWRSAGFRGKVIFVLYNLLFIGSFLGHYALIGREQINPEKSVIHAYLLDVWQNGFPPANLLMGPLWWLDQQTGRMLAYPCGDSHGGSTATFILALVGCAVWWKRGQRTLLAMMLAPFALNLVAAILHKYPYGSCGRVSQHLAPASCLLAATGMAYLIERFSRSLRQQLHCAYCCAALLLVGLLGVAVSQARRPHRDDHSLWTRGVVRELTTHMRSGDQIVVFCEGELNQANGAVLWWYLRTQKHPVQWGGKLDSPVDTLPANGCVWVCDQRRGPQTAPRRSDIDLWARKSGRQVVNVVSWFLLPQGFGISVAERVDLYLCVPVGQPVERPFFSQWPKT